MTDYAELMPAVAVRLLGEPSMARETELRYGSRGSLRIDMQAGVWYDHENEKGGGVLDLICREQGGTHREAVKWLEQQGLVQPSANGAGGGSARSAPKQPAPPRAPANTARKPAAKTDAPPPWERKIDAVYNYTDPDTGEIVCQKVRFGDGLQPKFIQRLGPNDWKRPKGVKRPLYRLPELLDRLRNGHTVLIVEGEKDVDNLWNIGLPATTPPDGAGKWRDVYTPYFADANVVIIPDNDTAGHRHAELVASKLHGVAKSVRVVYLPNLPEKGDVTDWLNRGASKQDLIAICKQAPEWQPAPEPDAPEQPEAEHPEPPDYDPSIFDVAHETAPFRALGFNHSEYAFLPSGTEQIVRIDSSQATSRGKLMELASLEWWQAHFPTKTGVDWIAAANACIRWAQEAGIFSLARVRGRGAWFDNGRSVLHLGDRLIVDGERVNISDLETRYIYEAESPLEGPQDHAPATVDQARELRLLFTAGFIRWKRPIHGLYALGWAVLGPICGALKWRPHIWITGSRGSGKTWLLDNIVAPILGESAFRVVGATTEAGIRQGLCHDALPVLFDEGEGQSRRDLARVQGILELARQSSSESDGAITKGTAGGKSQTFRIRSMFCIGSTNPTLSIAADVSRFTVLELEPAARGAEGRQQFEELQGLVNALMTREFCTAIRSRMYHMIPVIRDNADTFAKAAAEKLGSQRTGDQIGALLAGAYAATKDGRIGLEAARKWICEKQDEGAWEEQADAEAVSDEQHCLDAILTTQVRMSNNQNMTLGELVSIASMQGPTDAAITAANATETLGRYGLRVDLPSQTLIVSNTHPELRKQLTDTPFEAGWPRLLARLDGAEKRDPVRFGPGFKSRAVSVPLSYVVDNSDG